VRVVANLALVVLCVSYAIPNTVIEIRSYLPSAPDPCFIVLKNGKRVGGISIEVYKEGTVLGKSPYWKSLTNGDGIACPSELTEGKYEVFARLARRSSELDIEVSKKNGVAGFEMALRLPDQLDAAARASTKISLQTFRGVVEDASGAVMPKVRIEVLRKDSGDVGDENPALKSESNERGQFSCDLKKGTYVAIFESPGFNVTAFPFDVDSKGWDGLELTMQIGDMNRTPPRLVELFANK
jgi:hypothetical protein